MLAQEGGRSPIPPPPPAPSMATESVGLLVPAQQIGKVIGKAGSGLKEVREASGGVKVEVQQSQSSDARSRRVDLIGSNDQIVRAFHVVLIKAFPDECPEPVLLIHPDKAGRVIGKNGDNLKKVRQECRVRVLLEREPVVDQATGTQERLLKLQGMEGDNWGAEQMARALHYVLHLTGVTGPSVGAGAGSPVVTWGQPPQAHAAFGHQMPVATPATSLQVRHASSDPWEIQLHFCVPQMLAGAIIGKAGAQVKQTATVSGCKVSMTKKDIGAERRAVLIGSLEQCSHAQNIIYEQLLEAAQQAEMKITEVEVIFFIRPEAAGAVIGKQGASLKLIREQSGAKIQLDREPVEGHRACRIKGVFESVLQAEKQIFEYVSQVDVKTGAAARSSPGGGKDGPAGHGVVYGGAGYNSGAAYASPETYSEGMAYGGETYGEGKAYGGAARGGGYVYGGVFKQGAAGYGAGGVKREEPDAYAPPAAKRQRVEDDDVDATKLLVPATSAGAMIGKQGANLKALRESTGAHVKMLAQAEAPQWQDLRMLIIMGECHVRTAALTAALRTAFQEEDRCTLRLLVAKAQAGAIIGKGGDMLKRLREECGVKVQVERNEVAGERLVSSEGDLSQVSAVAAAILQILESNKGGASAADSRIPAWEYGQPMPIPGASWQQAHPIGA
mmetsp:Transcript_44568/g.100845  ORF Transcript_44568/g.100845 Transcript_44568/m.100845 type:complete len:671 (+) Transcript_44568:1-2013(+)